MIQPAPGYGNPHDERLRLAAFAWLEEQTTLHGEVLPWTALIRGFDLDGHKIPLVSMQGIFKPAAFARWPLTLRTSAEGPYDDHFTRDDLLLYAYRGTDPREPDNVRLRDAMRPNVSLLITA